MSNDFKSLEEFQELHMVQMYICPFTEEKYFTLRANGKQYRYIIVNNKFCCIYKRGKFSKNQWASYTPPTNSYLEGIQYFLKREVDVPLRPLEDWAIWYIRKHNL